MKKTFLKIVASVLAAMMILSVAPCNGLAGLNLNVVASAGDAIIGKKLPVADVYGCGLNNIPLYVSSPDSSFSVFDDYFLYGENEDAIVTFDETSRKIYWYQIDSGESNLAFTYDIGNGDFSDGTIELVGWGSDSASKEEIEYRVSFAHLNILSNVCSPIESYEKAGVEKPGVEISRSESYDMYWNSMLPPDASICFDESSNIFYFYFPEAYLRTELLLATYDMNDGTWTYLPEIPEEFDDEAAELFLERYMEPTETVVSYLSYYLSSPSFTDEELGAKLSAEASNETYWLTDETDFDVYYNYDDKIFRFFATFDSNDDGIEERVFLWSYDISNGDFYDGVVSKSFFASSMYEIEDLEIGLLMLELVKKPIQAGTFTVLTTEVSDSTYWLALDLYESDGISLSYDEENNCIKCSIPELDLPVCNYYPSTGEIIYEKDFINLLLANGTSESEIEEVKDETSNTILSAVNPPIPNGDYATVYVGEENCPNACTDWYLTQLLDYFVFENVKICTVDDVTYLYFEAKSKEDDSVEKYSMIVGDNRYELFEDGLFNLYAPGHIDENEDGICERCLKEFCKHKNTEKINVKVVTCKEDGYSGDTYCKDCFQTFTDGHIISKETVEHSYGKFVNTKEPTIREEGECSRTCSVCGKTDTKPIEKLKSNEAKDENTNTQFNYDDAAYDGQNVEFNVELKKQNECFYKIPGLYKVYSITSTVNGVETQPKSGVVVKIKIPEDIENPQSLNVYHIDSVTNEQTLVTDSKVFRENNEWYIEFLAYSFSDYIIADETVECMHNYICRTTSATCISEGSKDYTCAICDDSYSEPIEIAPTNHSFTNYVYNNDERVGVDGTETAKCDRCTAIDTRTKVGSAKASPVYAIRNMSKYNGQTIELKSSLTIYADVQNCTDVKWFVTGANYTPNADGSITINQATTDFSVYFTAKDIDGNTVTSEIETVKVKTGFFAMLVAFFKGLFKLLPDLKQ